MRSRGEAGFADVVQSVVVTILLLVGLRLFGEAIGKDLDLTGYLTDAVDWLVRLFHDADNKRP